MRLGECSYDTRYEMRPCLSITPSSQPQSSLRSHGVVAITVAAFVVIFFFKSWILFPGLLCWQHTFLAKETAEDEAVTKVIQQAATSAAANAERSDTSPHVTMKEGQKDFVAASNPGAGDGKEHVTTEAEIVAPAKGVEAGDRVVEPKPKQMKIPAATVKVSAVHL